MAHVDTPLLIETLTVVLANYLISLERGRARAEHGGRLLTVL